MSTGPSSCSTCANACLDRVGGADVHLEPEDPFEIGCRTRSRGDPRTLVAQRLGDAPADALRCAGDERDAALDAVEPHQASSRRRSWSNETAPIRSAPRATSCQNGSTPVSVRPLFRTADDQQADGRADDRARAAAEARAAEDDRGDHRELHPDAEEP